MKGEILSIETTQYIQELKNTIESQSDIIQELQQRIDKAIELIKNDDIIVKHQEFENKYTVNFYDRKKKLLNILEGKDEKSNIE